MAVKRCKFLFKHLPPTPPDVYVIMEKRNKVDAQALKAAKLVVFAATPPDPDNKLSILDDMRARK